MLLKSLIWGSDMALLLEAAKNLGIDLKARSVQDVADHDDLGDCIESMKDADVILLHPSHQDEYFREIQEKLGGKIPIISFGFDQSLWEFSSVSAKIVATVNAYIVYGGLDNIENMLKYIGKEVLGLNFQYKLPEETLWYGLYHPDSEKAFKTVEDYLDWYKPHRGHAVGVLFFRTYWMNGDLAIVDAMIRELEKKFDVIPAFCLGMGDKELNAKSSGEVVLEFFLGRVDAIINLQSVFHAGSVQGSVDALKTLDIPVIHPLTVYHKTEAEWRGNIHGMDSSEVGWSVAMPEFEGVIEPIIAGTATRDVIGGTEYESHRGIDDRIKKIAGRVGGWVNLRNKPISERKVAFILHNNPCASVEATVGAGAHLDTLESMARILNRMAEIGYAINSPPEDGKQLIDNIMDHKALSEFRWTPVEEIVRIGGALELVGKEDYESWFDGLAEEVKAKVCDAWGKPPGEEKDDVPPAMVYQGKIVVTGVQYGNAIVCVQPKRGCAGSRCDGQVCKMLHDPDVPPTHQYLATYHYIGKSFGADLIVHVGTHGNLEFLPGKSIALSDRCYPDIAVGDMPHLYIYNSDNPPEGTIAKRRSYAVLVDHMQTVMTESGLYGELKELEEKIAEYNRTKVSDHGRAHALEHIILDILKRTNLAEEMGLKKLLESKKSFEVILEKTHEKISEIYSTQIPDGMHIFGEVPKDEKRMELINSILRFDSNSRRFISVLMDKEFSDEENSAELDLNFKAFIQAVLQGDEPVIAAEKILGGHLKNKDQTILNSMRDQIVDLSARIEASDEMTSLLHGFDGGYIEPGPSGLITRGKPEVMPTGRNFYSLDPANIPTEAAGRVGKKLAESLINKYREEHNRLPENVAMFWMANDIMWADGEQLAQMMYLIGAEPVWKGGKVTGYRIISLEELGRPRIDLTIRVSSITRDCFMNCTEYLDQAIREVAGLNEPVDMNYIRKHSQENGDLARIFASKPGTYGNGVNLAVYASAWKEDRDLSDIFVQWNSYAYGKGVFGQEAHQSMINQLKSVDLTFNKTVTDEYDLFGCCCYFGTHGGLTGAARDLSGHEVSSYYGDTRDRNQVKIRTLADEVRRVVRTKLLNPKWIEGMKQHGYKGASDISKRVGRVYGWEATTKEVDDWIFDDIVRTFVMDEENRKFFQENNPWAMEEIGRRLLEASQRGLWKADKEVLDALKSSYLEIEGWMEEKMGDTRGQFQGGSIDVITMKEIHEWKDKVSKVLKT